MIHQTFITLSESRTRVDDLVRKAIAAGGLTIDEPQEYGFMYHHGFVAPDGHCRGFSPMSAAASV